MRYVFKFGLILEFSDLGVFWKNLCVGSEKKDKRIIM